MTHNPIPEGHTLVTGRTARGIVQFITDADFDNVKVGDCFTMNINGEITEFTLTEMEWNYHGQGVIRGKES